MAKTRSTRLWFVLSFPLLMAAIWGALAAIAGYERSQLVDQLTSQLTSGNVRGSLAAVRQLALTPHGLLEPIVVAATSPDRNLAGGAQLAISDLIEQWQQHLDAGRHARLVADGVNELAAALDANHEAFAVGDGPWLTRTVGELVRLANRVSPAGLEFTSHCESLLSAAGQGGAPAAASPSLPPVNSQASPTAAPAEFGRAAKAPSRRDADPMADVSPRREFATSVAAEGAFSAPPASAYQSITAPDVTPASVPSDTLADSTPAQSAVRDGGRRAWSSNSGETSDGTPSERNQADQAKSATRLADVTPQNADSLTAMDSRSLLQRWRSASKLARVPFEQELARRGFGRPNAKLASIVFSDSVDDRVRLVQELMAAPGVNTKAWILMLAVDPDAEVRAAAVTLMATSSDPQLAEQAYQAAIHDRDPRVADLAGRLRDRRDNVQRR